MNEYLLLKENTSFYIAQCEIQFLIQKIQFAFKNPTVLMIIVITFISQGEKDITITDANNFNLILPTLEYHSRTWTWQDLVQAVKKDYKLTLVPQVCERFCIV